MRLLICEQEDIMLNALEFRLKKLGFEIIKAKETNQALDLIDSQDIDFVITNIAMENFDGKYVVGHLKTKHKDTPVLVIATLDSDEDQLKELFELGASDFIMKPFKPAELIFRVERLRPNVS